LVARRCRLLWIRDVLPDDLAVAMGAAMSHGLGVVSGPSTLRWSDDDQGRRACTVRSWSGHWRDGDVAVHPRRPDWGYQRDTAVPAAHRGRGLGRCVKACMVRWLLAEHPALEWISTTTGADNAHMIRVNRAVGFTTLPAMLAVQQDLAAVEALLGT
jgi:GNAT superfamily N-acetyltransferase